MDWIRLIVIVGLALFECLAVVIGFINFPKRKNADLIVKKEYVSSLLPYLIGIAENYGSTGSEKKELVIGNAISAIEKHFGVLKDKDKLTLTRFISTSVESILTTPQKKLTDKEV